jgi:C4-dicarboxylate-specific signal transduction histidine kinase
MASAIEALSVSGSWSIIPVFGRGANDSDQQPDQRPLHPTSQGSGATQILEKFNIDRNRRRQTTMSRFADSTEIDLREQLRLTQDALQRSERFAMAGRFSGAIMHEINNPLEAITNLVYLIKLKADDPKSVKCYAEQAEEHLALVRNIAGQTLSFYRDQRTAHDVNIVDLLETALRIHTKRLLEKQVDIQRRLPEKLIIQGNSGELLEVLSNLIVNALEALSIGGILYLRVRSYGETTHITVADNGSGIPEEIRASLFAPFHSSKGEAGTGLGLWLSKTLIHRNRGQISWRSSIRPGRTGTAFRISLAA